MSEPALETKALETKALDTPYEAGGIEGWLIERARGVIRKKLGTDYDPAKLIGLLGAVCREEKLNDSDVLDLAEMFIHFMEKELKWTLGVQVFRHYLNDGGQADANLFLPNSHLLDSPDFRLECCITQSERLKKAVAARVADTTGVAFPRDESGQPKSGTVDDEFGQPIAVVPQPSPLRAGGTETIYVVTSVRITSVSDSELAATFNRIGVISKVAVTSAKTSDTSWDVSISSWTSWGYDLADFNPPEEGSIQSFPIDVGSFFSLPWVEEKVTKILEERFDVSFHCLQQLVGFDSYMRQLANRQFSRTNIVTGQPVHYFPKPFYARFASWDFLTETNGCGMPSSYTITEAAQ